MNAATVDLTTTNTWLAVLAIVALLEVAAIVGLCLGAFLFYRRVMRAIGEIEERQVAPVTARLKAILDDVQGVMSKVRIQAERIERLVRWAARSSWGSRRGPDDGA